jgi:hypothetical protein
VWGTVCLVGGLGLLALYGRSGPAEVGDYARVRVVPDDVYVTEGHRGDLILSIESGGRRYQAKSLYWRHSGYHAEDLLDAIRPGEPVTLWVTDSSSRGPNIRGIESARVSAGPETGVAADNENRAWLLALALGFTAMGAVTLYRGRGLHPSAV